MLSIVTELSKHDNALFQRIVYLVTVAVAIRKHGTLTDTAISLDRSLLYADVFLVDSEIDGIGGDDYNSTVPASLKVFLALPNLTWLLFLPLVERPFVILEVFREFTKVERLVFLISRLCRLRSDAIHKLFNSSVDAFIDLQ